MIVVLLGPSGSGKSAVQSALCSQYGFERMISYTTRPKRDNETNHVDYHFVNHQVFSDMEQCHAFAEVSEYSQHRKYGTFIQDYASTKDTVAVLTPDGLREARKHVPAENLRAILIDCNLGERIIRYINRIGPKNFTFDDKNEICARVERDYGMFLNMEKYVDLVVHNDEYATIESIAEQIVNYVRGT